MGGGGGGGGHVSRTPTFQILAKSLVQLYVCDGFCCSLHLCMYFTLYIDIIINGKLDIDQSNEDKRLS